MIEKNLGPGFAPDIGVIDGLVSVAFGNRQNDQDPGWLEVVALTPLGVKVRRQIFQDGFFNSFPRFDGPWLVYRQSAAHGYCAAAFNVLTGQALSFRAAGGNFGLTVSESLGLVAYEWQRPGEPWHVWFGNLGNGQTAETPLLGAPDGLDTIVSATQVTLRKDTRQSVPGMYYPVRRRDLVMGEYFTPPYGVAVQLDGDVLRVALQGQNCPVPSGATDGQTYAVVTGGPQGVRLCLGSRADVLALPAASSLTTPVDVPRIGRPLWCGWFTGTPTSGGGWTTDISPASLPGNCYIVIPGGEIRTMDGRRIGWYCNGVPDTDQDAIDLAIATAQAAHPGERVFAYWPRGAWARVPATPDVVVEAYQLKDESVADFRAAVVSAMKRCERPSLAVQVFTSNPRFTTNLAGVAVVAAQIVQDTVCDLFAFNGTGRKTGLEDHPEVRPVWEAIFQSVTGTPPLDAWRTPVPRPPPTPPSPIPPPRPTPTPVPSPLFPPARWRRGVAMHVYLRFGEHYIGVDPATPDRVYRDRDAGGAWEAVDLTPIGGGHFLARFLAADRVLSIQPDGALQTRPAGTDGGYEAVLATTQPDGISLLYRTDAGTLLGMPLVIEEIAA